MFVKFDIDKKVSDEIDKICNVKTELSGDGKKARVLFDDSNSNEYLYTFIFDITDEEYNRGIDLTSLMQADKSVDIIDRRTPHDHKVNLTRTGVRCLLYRARYDTKENTYYLLDQNRDNVTDVLKIQPTICCNIRYEKVRTGILKFASLKEKKAIMKISGDLPEPGICVRYSCRGGGRDHILFGIDLMNFWNKEIEIVLKKEEEVKFFSPEDGSFHLKVLG